ncbi:hypothetical protein L3Q82_015206, partial [Scortum barcoo]
GLYIHRLAGKCSWTLRIHGKGSSNVVALTADSTHELVKQICQDLDCGGVYHVNTTKPPLNTTCFHNCLHEHGRLQNCSETMGENCIVITEAVCGHHAVRLSGGSGRCAGRVELWRNGGWGTVCDDGWDLRDADVVCAQLGCGYALSVTGQGGAFPPGKGPVHLDELNCTGREENLWACPAAQDEHDCGHKEDAGVVCSEMRAVRLTGGLDRCSGKVEVHRNGSWGTVCDNCWNEKMASLVCSMLKCNKPKQFSQFVPSLTHNNGTLWFYVCYSNEQSLWECKELINKPHLCASSKASGVVCNGERQFLFVAVQKVSSLGFPTPTTFATTNATVTTLNWITAFLLHQTRTSSRATAENNHNYQEAVNLIKVSANPPQTDGQWPNTSQSVMTPSDPRYLWTQLSSVDSTSVDTDYEQFEPSNDPSVPLSTFRSEPHSQRYKTDANPFMKPSGLDSLFEEEPKSENPPEVLEAFTGTNSGPTDAQYARVSKISVDSFDSSSTSSGECYENTNGYVMVTPGPSNSFTCFPSTTTLLVPKPNLEVFEESGEGQSSVAGTFDPSIAYSNDQLHSRPAANLQSSGDEDDGPIYAPVSPDQDSSTDDDYDDIRLLMVNCGGDAGTEDNV